MSARLFSEADIPRLREEYKKLGSYRAVAEKHNCNQHTILYLLNPKAHAAALKAQARFRKTQPRKKREQYLRYRKKHRQRYLAGCRRSAKKFSDNNPEAMMLRNAKKKCKRLGLSFNLKISDIFIPDFCPVLGIPLIRGKTVTGNTPSLDQINRTRGYVKGNVAVISWRANRLKNDATLKEVTAIAAYMRRNEKIHE